MPSLAQHHSKNFLKMLLIGHSSTGKTGSLASLADAGYQLKVADFDNGLDILANVVGAKYPNAAGNVEYETFTDAYMPSGSNLIPIKVEAWQNGIKQMNSWSKEFKGNQDVILVIDSLTLMSRAMFNWILKTNNKQNGPPELQHWGAAQNILENFLSFITSDELEMNVILISHITYYGEDENSIKIGFPSSAVGKSFSPKIQRFFNSVLLMESSNNGQKREIVTKPTKFIDLKNSAPFKVKDRYPIEQGLAQYFADVTGRKPSSSK